MTTLIRSNKTRYPWLAPEFLNFFSDDDFFNTRFWTKSMVHTPAMNVIDKGDYFLVELAAPGLTKEDFEITIDNGYLKIHVEKSEELKEDKENYSRKEFSYNSFDRSLLLPENVIEEEVRAKYEKGILKFKLTKMEMGNDPMTRRIEIE